MRGELLFDDVNAIVSNVWVRTGDVAGILTHASWWSEARGHGWRPLTTLTFAVDHAIHGLAPVGYHVVNVLLHAAVSVLVFAVFSRVTSAPLPAAIAAALFAAHPVHTEAVASVVGRAELLAAAGFFLAWLLFLRADVRVSRVPSVLLEALGVAIFFAALLAKENALALLPVLVFVDLLYAPAGARVVTLRRHTVRYAALAAATLVFVLFRHRVLGRESAEISILDNPLVSLPPLASELTALKVAGLYGWRLLVPWRLAADYSYRQISPVASPLDAEFLAALAVCATVPVLAWWTWRRAPAAALGLGLLALAFVMVSNLVFPIGTIMAERLVYLPSAGFCLVAAVLLERATLARGGRTSRTDERRVEAAHGGLGRLRTPRLAVPLAVVLALYGARTWSRNAVWRDRLTFFSTMVAEAPESARSQREFGAVLADLGKFDLARASFERSLAIKPEDAATLYNLGNVLVQERRPDDAIAIYQRALAVKPDFVDAMVNLGNAESLRGDHQAALTWMRRALVLTPRAASLHMNIANELFRLGSHPEARAEYEAALAIAPGAPDVLTNYGAFLYALGEYEAAVGAYQRAGDVPMALVGLTATYRMQGKAAEARTAHARAARLFPLNAAVRQMGEVLDRDAAAAGATGG
ncbi:MAG: tetratricopeptide repeat protein [Deltaproteobacteria bacterium]|nr:tetratricopeptide repeat protein [Deltaproteobacteria bacterium]